MTDPRHAAGARAEAVAAAYLSGRGLRLVARNYRCRSGELDLVMDDGDELVVVEIRYRRRHQPVDPAASITADKRARIIRATAHFLARHHGYAERPLRFDVLALTGGLERPRLRWIRAAFDDSDAGA